VDEKYNFVNTLSIINQSRGMIQSKILKNENPLYLKRINKISCGDGFTVCLDKDGIIYSWGKCNKGQLGYELEYSEATIISGNKCQTSPRIVPSLIERNIKIIDISCGSDFVYALDLDNRIFSWGNNSHSQLARTSSRVVQIIPELSDLYIIGKIKIFKCGWMHSVVLNNTGEAFIIGNPFYDYDKTFLDIKFPRKVSLDLEVVKIDTGFHHISLLTIQEEDRTELYTLGANEYGQCGFAISKESKLILNPSKVLLPETGLKDSICGAYHTICLMKDDKLLSFGHNLYYCN
jgi:alpha-tubulin suppressor-like RCC1 family protein